MTKNRVTAIAALATCSALIELCAPTSASAYDEAHFCNYVLQPAEICGGNMAQRNWRQVRTRYPGAEAHNVTGCVFMYNFANSTYRAGSVFCLHTWDTHPFGKDFGPTSLNNYKSYNQLPGGESAHTLSGWTCRETGSGLNCPPEP
jgi:hypothetical protein